MTTLDKLSAALADRYAIEREIGAGGMATVYLAQDIRHRRKVAIKVLHPELTAVLGPERFLNEIELTANLQHPHILPLFDSGAADNLLFYVMPFVQGETLRGRLTREHQLPIAEAVRIAGDIADALEYAHKHGVVHRDIKPENVLLHDGRPLVADFGIALAVQQAGGERMTQTGMSLGTPQYMAPEQAMGDKAVDHRADIYALGAMTYEMLTGEPPFTGPTAQAVVAKILTTDPSSLVSKRRSVPPHVEAAVLTALEKMPADRFATAAQFADAIAGRGPMLDTRATVTARAIAHKRDWRRRALGAGPWIVAVVAAAMAMWALTRPPDQPITRSRVVLWRATTPLTVVARGLAISNDGAYLAFIDTVGGQRMWLKERHQLDATPIAGTNNAFGVTFSPDGEWIAFAADGKLKKVPRMGGSPIILSDSASPNPSIAWLDNDTILFTTANIELLGVPADGGPSRRVVSQDSSGRGVLHVSALPGGHALISTCSPGCEDAELRSLDLESGRTVTLAAEALQGWFVDGHIVFVRRDGGVFTAPFDGGKLSLARVPVPVLSGVRTSLVMGDIAVSPAGVLAYIAGSAQEGTTVQPVWVSRAGQVSVIDTGWSFIAPANWGMALSPDGARLAVGARVSGSDDIWIKELRGGALRRLTFEGGNTRAAGWTRDGRSVIYVAFKRASSDLRMRRADGTGAEETLVDIDRGVFEVALTPDSTQLLVRAGQPPSRDILLVRRGDSTVPVVAAPRFHESWPMLSRDGRWLAYGSDESGKFEVFVRPFPDVNGGKWQISRNGGFEPYWAHNGRELFYRDGAGNLVAAAVQTTPTFSIGDQRVLFPLRGLRTLPQGRSFDVAPDDGRFVFTRLVGNPDESVQPLVFVENWGRELRNATRRGQ